MTRRLTLTLLTALLVTPAAWADTTAPCGTEEVGVFVDVDPATQGTVEDILSDGGRIYFKTTMFAEGSQQAAVDYIAEANRHGCTTYDENGNCFVPHSLFVPVASSNPLGNLGTHSFYIDFPDHVTCFRLQAWAFKRCGAVNGTSTLHKFFSVGQDASSINIGSCSFN
jgi:hypothetical protein